MSTLRVADGVINFHADFTLMMLPIKTHASLFKLVDGSYALIDSIDYTPEQLKLIKEETQNGKLLKHCIQLHPFHTLSVSKTAELFPECTFYGTVRHHQKNTDVKFHPTLVESPEFPELFKDDFEFSIPEGVHFIHPTNEKVHFGSVLLYHRATETLHVDDTFNFMKLPWPLSKLFNTDVVSVHPTLSSALLPRSGAGQDFAKWCKKIAHDWPIKNFLAAHNASVRLSDLKKSRGDNEFNLQIEDALAKVSCTLESHDSKFANQVRM